MDGVVAHLNNALAGRYAIEREIGRGGMATVYVAHDLKHDRRVALKVVDRELTAVLGAERFLSEIRVTANLQHPNLLPLFDSGESEGLLYYVMPFVDGETLRVRLAREKQLPVDDAVRIAVAVAGGLDYAHRHGVIHRDLKPENILLHDGQPLVADFGIALALSNAGGSRITQTGISLGTPQYMSPEQATGDRAIDARTDVYSLGAVLYEMLTGDPPHTGSTAQAVIAHLLTEAPRSVRAERSAVPEHVAIAVDAALAKLPADRWSTAQEFADALDGTTKAKIAASAAPGMWRRPSWLLAGAVAVGSAAAGAFIGATVSARGRLATPTMGPARFPLTLGIDRISLLALTPLNTVAVSPDGRLLAVVASTRVVDSQHPDIGPRMIYVRTLRDPHVRPVEGTQGALQPFFSPDSKWLGFRIGRRLMKASVDGGAAVPIGEVPNLAATTWVTADYIVCMLNGGLGVISAAGDPTRALTRLDTAHGESEQRWPVALPDGKTILYASAHGLTDSRIAVASFPDGRTQTLDLPGTAPLGVVDGELAYVGPTGTLMAVPFDVRRRRLMGPPVPLADRFTTGPRGDVNASLSAAGPLVYQLQATDLRGMVGDSTGAERVLLAEPRQYAYPRFSPDGRRIAVTITVNGRRDIWIYTVADRTLTRLTSEGTSNERPEWSPDGKFIIYRSAQDGRSTLWQRPSDGSGPASMFFAPRAVDVWDGMLSPDGHTLLYRAGALASADIFYRRLDAASGDTTPHAFAATPFSELSARFSPNGRWVAYSSDESGTNQVYVRPFPGPGARVQISTDGGEAPVWSHDGRRLYFLGDQQIIAADLSFGSTLGVTRRTTVLRGDFGALNIGHAGYDVMPDDKGLFVFRAVGDPQTIVVLNWTDEARAARAQTPNWRK